MLNDTYVVNVGMQEQPQPRFEEHKETKKSRLNQKQKWI